MRPISSSDGDLVLASFEEGDASLEQSSPKPAFTEAEKAYYRSLREAVLYLDTYLAKGPGFAHAPKPAKGSEEANRQRDWVVGYARPLRLAGVASIDLMPAADRFMAKSGDFRYFPTPPQLISCADAVRSDRLARAPMPVVLALDTPAISREEWIRRSNETRERIGLDPLQEEADVGQV